MQKDEYIKIIRGFLHDPQGKVFDNDELETMLKTAADTYCKDTALYRGVFSLYVDSEAVGKLPDDYIEFVAGWNGDGFHLECADVDYLRTQYGHYLAVEGHARFIYEDLDNIGQYRICPNPYKFENLVLYIPENPYGVMLFESYGTAKARKGYGIPVSIAKFDNIGDVAYVKTVSYEAVQDYMALIYHAVYQAYTIDSDFQDADKARLFFIQYRGRVARVGNVIRSVPHVRREANFF